mmetsp:Transcript_72066/g.204574  ORF Transcript_72066/g.204574 Transcript_72066/m.204574 type:complete len:282 (-) Transcript_72066:1125-1970(-)
MPPRRHHRHGPRPGAVLGAAVVGGMVGAAVVSGPPRHHHPPPRRGGPNVVVINNQSPSPMTRIEIPQMAVEGVSIESYYERPSATFYVLTVRAITGETWQCEHRFREFVALRDHLAHSFRCRTEFPSKHIFRSVFGLSNAMKDERRMQLQQWLASVIQMVANPAFHRNRAAIYRFLAVPLHVQQSTAVAQTTIAGPIPPQQGMATVVASGEPQYAPIPVSVPAQAMAGQPVAVAAQPQQPQFEVQAQAAQPQQPPMVQVSRKWGKWGGTSEEGAVREGVSK